MARKLKRAVVQTPIKVEPITPASAITYALTQFGGEVKRFEERREKFLEDAKVNLGYALEWADAVLQMEYSASKLKNIITAYEERKTDNDVDNLALLKKFVDHVREDNRKSLLNDWFRGNSTSPSHNSVQHNRRAGASHLESVLEYVSYYIADAEKGLQHVSVQGQ